MGYLILSLVIIINIYGLRKPGFIMAYLLFFQSLNNLLFSQIGLVQLKFFLPLFFLLFFFVKFFSKKKFVSLINNFFLNKISIGYLILVIYMSMYALFIGGNYEFTFVKMFLFPGLLLFLISSTCFYKVEMYHQLFNGIILFTIVFVVSIITFNGLDALSDRTFSEDVKNISSITQGRLAGLLSILLIILIIYKKTYSKYFIIAALVLSFFWLSITGTRGALVALFGTLFFYFLVANNRLLSSKYLFLLSSLFIPILFYYGLDQNLLYVRSNELIDLQKIEGMTRIYRWKLFFQYYPENFIFGLGPGGWGKYIMIGEYRYPHNIIIEFLLMYGLVGLISFLFISFSSLSTVIKILRNDIIDFQFKGLVLCWIYYFIAAMFSGSFIYGNFSFFVFSGLLVSINYHYKQYFK